MGSRGKTGASMRLVWACLAAVCLLLSGCLPCQGRKLMAAGEEGKVMYFEVGLEIRVPPPPVAPAAGSGGVEAAARWFSATGRAARLMRSVPSPGVGH
ncbi:hypothetical protein ACP70R_035713 [Stipagrostis hirtigluma subsp. patula]